MAEHGNAELDVLIVVLGGTGVAIVDGEAHAVAAGHALLVERGATRRITAGEFGMRYLSIHRRRGPLQITPLARALMRSPASPDRTHLTRAGGAEACRA